MDWLLFFIRSAITLTFLILAIFGPWALIKLNSFIRKYTTALAKLVQRVQTIERHLGITPPDEEKP